MRRLTQDVRLSTMLQLGYLMPAAGARYERDALRRAARLALAKRHGIVRPTEERIRQRITELRLFADEHGTFDPRRYELFREQLRADNEFKEADIVRVIGDDLRIGQVEGLLAGPGYVVPAEIEYGMTFSTTQWFLQAAVFATDDLPPLSEPGELVLADYFGKNLATFEIPERMETDYVRFPAESFVGYEPLPEDEVVEHFERNRERFASPGNGFAAGTGNALAQVRPQVEESLRLERAGRKAAEVAANFTVELYERRITGDAPELDALIRQFRGERAKSPVFERKAILPRGNWTDEIVEAAFQLGTSRFASDALPFGRDHIVLLWRAHQPRRTPELEEVRGQVREAYRNHQRQEQVQRLGRDWKTIAVPQLAAGRTFEAVCATIPNAPAMRHLTIGPFARQLPPDGLPATVLQALGDAPVLSLTEPIREKNEVYWIYIAGKRKPRVDRTSSDYARATSQLTAEAATAWRSSILEDLVDDELARSEATAK